ncbi:MAG: 50S ribosomal protein L9 [bacterium]|nr:50S ribosomal protein L9 [bacterium]
MKVILLKDVKGVGKSGELITTSDGHAMNLLLPKKLAVQATPVELAKYKASIEKDAKETESLKARAKKLAGVPLRFVLKTGPHGEVFNSITKEDIAHVLKKAGYETVKIDLDKPLRTLGTHHAVIHLGKGIETKIRVETVGDK